MEEKQFLSSEKIRQELDEYKNFAYGKNLFAMAMALILANSMQKFVSNISENILMPVINFLVSKTQSNWRNLIFNPIRGLEIEVGKFFGGFLEFSITTIFLYIIYIKIIKKIFPKAFDSVIDR